MHLPIPSPRIGVVLVGLMAVAAWLASPASAGHDHTADDGHHALDYGSHARWPGVDPSTTALAGKPAKPTPGHEHHVRGNVVAHVDEGQQFVARDRGASFAQALPPFRCDGDGTEGQRVQVLYVRQTGAADRLAERRSTFVESLRHANQIVQDSAAQQGGSRSIRFVHDASCTPTIISETVSASAIGDFGVMIDELRRKGYDSGSRVYMALVDSRAYCGIGEQAIDDRAYPTNILSSEQAGALFSRVDEGCTDGVTVAHELFHNFGAVQDSAPSSNRVGHCNDGADVMCYAEPGGVGTYTETACPGNPSTQLDCNHDTYFHPNPPSGSYLATHWNTADSIYLVGGRSPAPGGGGGGDSPPPGASPPPNDAFAAATVLASGTSAPLDVTGATAEPGEPTHAGVGGPSSAWYRISPQAGDTVTVTVDSNFDPVAAIYTGSSVGGLRALASADDVDGFDPVVQVTSTDGAVLHVAVAGYGSSRGTGTVSVRVDGSGTPPPPVGTGPANDDLAAAAPLRPGTPAPLDLIDATAEAGEPVHAGLAGNASVWYRLDAPTGEDVVVTVRSDFDPVAAAYAGDGQRGFDGLVLLDEDDDTDGPQPQLRFTAPGGPVVIAVAGYRDSRGVGEVVATVGDTAVIRRSGPSRVETAIAVSQARFSTAPAVVLATAGNYPDALSGGPLARLLRAPILLTGTDAVHPATMAEIRRLQPQVVHLLGGTSALSPAVAAELEAAGFATARFAGTGRAGTAALVSQTFASNPEFVHLVTGRDWRAAMIAAGHAAMFFEPVLLLEPTGVPAETRDAILRLAPTQGVVVHSLPGEVGGAVFAELGQYATVFGNEGATVADLAATLLRAAPSAQVVAASDRDFPDGLAAGAYGRSVVLVPPTGAVPDTLLDAMRSTGVVGIELLGGVNAVDDGVAAQLRP